MEPTAIGLKLASSVIGPLVKKFFVADAPGAGLVDKPIRLSGYVSFKGEKRTLTESDVRGLATTLVERALEAGERPVPADEHVAVTDALAATLYALGDLTITDVDAVALGPEAFARALRRAGDHPERGLSADATYFYEGLLVLAARHILEFFTQRKTFVAHALVRQSRGLDELTAKTDELIRRTPVPDAQDAAFEATYLPYLAKRHGKLTIYGIDLSNSPTRWPLDVAYLSLEAAPLGFTEPSTRSRDAMAAASIARQGIPEPQPADQVLAHRHRVLLRGEAGSGKTTLVQWLAVTAGRLEPGARPDYLRNRVPFVLPLRTLTRHGQRLPGPREFLASTGCPLEGTQPAGWEHRVLSAGRGLVLVDGIDEIPEPERERTRRWLRELIDAYDGDNRWLVTSRPSAVGQNWLDEDGFTELTLSPMGPADVSTFIRRWHAAARAGEAGSADLDAYEGQLLTAVRTKPDLGLLATNPLMCGLICALHRDRRGYLPHGRKDLYEAALSMLVSRRDRERDMTVPDLREEPQLDLLQRLAYWLIKNGRTEMDRSRAEEIIERALPAVAEVAALGDAPTVLEHFLQRSGLLREPAPGSLHFVHRTFQDFLGARAAVEEGDLGLLTAHAADDQWEDVIRMAVALARPRERVTLFQDLLSLGDRTTDRRTRSRVFLLAAACLEHATTLEPAVREAVEQRTATLIPPRDEDEARALAEVGPLILDLLPEPEGLDDHMTAYRVALAASRVASDAALPYLARFVGHPSLPVRSQLVWAWSRFDSTRYADEIIARLDPAGLNYTVTSDEQVRQLVRLGLDPRSLDVRTRVSQKTLTEYLSGQSLVELTLSSPTATDLGFLAGQTELVNLIVDECPALMDISALAELPIQLLDISATPELDLSPLSRLAHLSELELDGPSLGRPWSPEMLPAHAPLTSLHVKGGIRPSRGLRGLGRLAKLRYLSLNYSSSPASAGDWREVESLPDLTHLSLDPASFETLPARLRLENLAFLVLNSYHPPHPAMLERLPEFAPRLSSLALRGNLSAGGHLDITALAALPELREITLGVTRARLRGLDTLPPSVRVETLA